MFIRCLGLFLSFSSLTSPTTLMKLFPILALIATALQSADASALISDNFDYANGPLAGQGAWLRGVSDPTADNPSDYISIENGQVKFDWTTTTPINNALRSQWSDDAMTSGIIYAIFQLRVTEAPSPANNARPGFISFDRSGGGQMRGFVGIQAGSNPHTFQIGISASSQAGGNFTFSDEDLEINTTYQLMIGYNVATADTRLWLNNTETADSPLLEATGSRSTNVRRIQLRLFNAGSEGETTKLGVFYLDDLQVFADTEGGEDPSDPSDPDTSKVYFTETFAYPNGLLLESATEWRIREGSPNHVVDNNRLLLNPASDNSTHYLTHNLSQSVDSETVYMALTMDLPSQPVTHHPVNIAFLTDASGAFGRAFMVLESTGDGWRVGVRGTSNGNIEWNDAILPPGSAQRWVIGFNTIFGSSSLWQAQDGPQAAPRAEVSGTGRAISRIAIGADAAMPESPIALRDLHVAHTREKASSAPVDIVELPHPDKVFLFLLIGQSNMAGRGAIEDQDRMGDRRIVTYNKDRQWQVARDPLHWDRPNTVGVGPAMSFARELLPNLPPDAVIAFIPAAEGGSSIAWWEKGYQGSNTGYGGQYLYHHALDRALEAKQIGTFAAILWNQGESDATAAENDGGQNYRNRLHGIIQDFRDDLGLPELPFIGSTLGPWRTNANALNAVYLNLPDEMEHTAVVNTHDPAVVNDLVNNPNDTPHYITPSYRLLGKLYAEAFRPWWQPSSAYVATVGGEVQAGSADFQIQFSTTGGLKEWRSGETRLISNTTATTGEWYLNGSSTPESLLYSFNPPLSFKWRSPKTMALWTVSENEMGVVLANNDNHEAIYRLSLNSEHLSLLRNNAGEWKTVAEADVHQPVEQLRWDFPDGKTIIWEGQAVLKANGIHGDIDLETTLNPKEVTHWHWQYGSKWVVLSPQAHAVYQRYTEKWGYVPVHGIAPHGSSVIELSIVSGEDNFGILPIEPVVFNVSTHGEFSGHAHWPAGGWFSIELIAYDAEGDAIAQQIIEPIGIGEVFVVAGQSNATNSGQTPTRPASPLVSAFSGSSWRPASDPMPGTHDNALGGSFQPSMGDALVETFGVPVGFASTGQGGSAIRHWQPDYEHDFENNTFHNGLYNWTLYRMRQFGPQGFRALLWHQGESNAARGQSNDPTKVDTYYESLKFLLQQWRSDSEWDIPVFTAKASLWPMANAEFGGDPYLREAQQKIWDDGIALPGPDTDQLGLEYRQDNNESRVHFNAAGLKRHGEMWAEATTGFIIESNAANAIPAPWEEASWLGEDWYQLPWFGDFRIYGGGFFDHQEHSIMYTPSYRTTSLWIHQDSLGWVWTSAMVYPFLWEHESGEWLYYLRGGHPQLRNFYRYESNDSGYWTSVSTID